MRAVFPACVVALAAATLAFAATDVKRPALSVVVKGRGHVTGSAAVNCPPTCFVRTRNRAKLTLRARAVAGWKFSRWGFSCHGTKPSCALTMSGPRHVVASFVKR